MSLTGAAGSAHPSARVFNAGASAQHSHRAAGDGEMAVVDFAGVGTRAAFPRARMTTVRRRGPWEAGRTTTMSREGSSAFPRHLPSSGSLRNSIDRENAVSTRRRDLVGGASALALLSGSSAAFAQSKEAPAQVALQACCRSGTGGGITIQGGSLARPANQEELRALLQAACHNGGGIAFDGSTPPIKINGTMEIRLRDVGDGGVYLNGNGLRLELTNRDGVTAAVRFIGKTRFLTVQGFNLYGGGYDTPGCGNGFEFVASGGISRSARSATLLPRIAAGTASSSRAPFWDRTPTA